MAGPNGVALSSDIHRAADLTSSADSRDFLFATHFNTDTAGESAVLYEAGASSIVAFDGTIECYLRNVAGTGYAVIIESSVSGLDGAWHHVSMSSDGTTAHLMIDGVIDASASITVVDEDIDFTVNDHVVGDVGDADYLEMAQTYLNTAEYLDLSVEANRLKLYSPAGPNSVEYGSDGSTPTGSQPIMYFEGEAASWETNLGYGGGFTQNGTLTDAITDPPPYASGVNAADGALVAGVATASGVATKSQPVADGVLTAGTANMAGAAFRNSAAEGVLTAQVAGVVGDADVRTIQQANGALAAQEAAVAGEATTLERWQALGALAAQEASIAGIATLNHLTDGAPVAQPAIVQGQAVLRHFSAGALAAQDATMRSRATAGDGWSSPEGGGETEAWAPVGKGGAEGWQQVDTGGNETWR